jgi:hypothetical protein
MLTCTGLYPRFSSNAHHHGSLPQQLGSVWDLLLKADPEGPSLISCAACHPHGYLVHSELLIRVLLQHTKAEKVFLVDLVEDGNHGLLDKFVFDSRDRKWTLPSIFFLYVHSSRGHRSIGSAMNSAMEINQPIFKSGLILLPGDPVHSRCGFPL